MALHTPTQMPTVLKPPPTRHPLPLATLRLVAHRPGRRPFGVARHRGLAEAALLRRVVRRLLRARAAHVIRRGTAAGAKVLAALAAAEAVGREVRHGLGAELDAAEAAGRAARVFAARRRVFVECVSAVGAGYERAVGAS